MNLLKILIFLTVISVGVEAQTITPCNVKAYVVHPIRRSSSTKVRSAPADSSAIVGSLSNKKLDTVSIIASSGNWIKINRAEDEDENVFFRRQGWIPVSLFGMSTASSPDTGFHYLYSGPNRKGRPLLKLRADEGVDLLSCSGKWVKVKVKRKIGWLAPEAQCSNSRTTCV